MIMKKDGITCGKALNGLRVIKLKEKKVNLNYECGAGGVVIHLRVRL